MTGPQMKEGTNFDGPAPVEMPVAAAPAGGGFAALAAKMAAAGGIAAAPAQARARPADSPAMSSVTAAVPLSAPTALTGPASPGPSIVILDSGAFISSGSAQLHATSAGFELLARLYREGSSAGVVPRFVTIAAVIGELKDEKTRAMLAALPFQIEVLSVAPDAVKEGKWCS
jgi:hypothetical protein